MRKFPRSALHSPRTNANERKSIPMSNEIQAISQDLSHLAHHARALVTATADVASDQVVEARAQLANVLNSGKHLIREKFTDYSRSYRESVSLNPYEAVGIALGVGFLIGFCCLRRCASSRCHNL